MTKQCTLLFTIGNSNQFFTMKVKIYAALVSDLLVLRQFKH